MKLAVALAALVMSGIMIGWGARGMMKPDPLEGCIVIKGEMGRNGGGGGGDGVFCRNGSIILPGRGGQ